MSHPSVKEPISWRFIGGVVVKGVVLYLLANVIFAAIFPMALVGRISGYNRLFPGRPRLPFGEVPERAYNVSLTQLEAMFASHEIAGGEKPADEFRVLLVGDSSVWGFLLRPEETLAGQINTLGLQAPDGRNVRTYNLGHPTISLTKDLLLLDYAMRYHPDMIIWMVTLESFPHGKQLLSAVVQHNPDRVRPLIDQYGLSVNPQAPEFVEPSFWQRTIVGQRRALADLVRLQLYGVIWAATGIDQDYPASYTARMEDLPDDVTYHGLASPLEPEHLAVDVLAAGLVLAGEIPVVIINEPMFVSQGENSHLRYNFFYPRWVYDEYRHLLAGLAVEFGWYYYDYWQVVSNTEFTNTAIHLSPAGSAQLAQQVGAAILEVLGEK